MEDSTVAEMWKLHVPIFLRKDGMTQWHLILVYVSVPFILVSISVIGHEFDDRYAFLWNAHFLLFNLSFGQIGIAKTK